MNKEQCRRLIELYSCCRRLWDSHHPDYSNKRLRDNAWKNISHKMSLPVDELRKKMDSLLGSYRREKSREKQSRTAESRSVYKSNWYAYEYFSFMKNKKNARHTRNTIHDDETPVQENNRNIEKEEMKEKEKQDQNNTEVGCDRKIRNEGEERKQMQKQAPIKRPRRRIIETVIQQEQTNGRVAPDHFELYKQYVGSPNDTYYTFGQHIANELRKYDPITLVHVKKAINNIIFEADIRSLQKDNTEYYSPLYPSIFGDSFATASDVSYASVSVPSSICTASPIPIRGPIPPPSPTPS